jgi:hypothetical protein
VFWWLMCAGVWRGAAGEEPGPERGLGVEVFERNHRRSGPWGAFAASPKEVEGQRGGSCPGLEDRAPQRRHGLAEGHAANGAALAAVCRGAEIRPSHVPAALGLEKTGGCRSPDAGSDP